MNSETKPHSISSVSSKCQNCKNDFMIESEDFGFYERVQSPPPVFCPDCRMQRRIAHRNERTLYRRVCDLCKKEKVSIYPPKTSFPVYCQPCWWSDDWDAKSFAPEYNPSKSFFSQFEELQRRVPRIGLLNLTSVNSEYTNNSADNKNCYLIFAAEQNEDCMYGRLVQHCKSSLDTAFLYDSELCYECVDCRQCYGCLFSDRCQSSSDLFFCSDMRDCQNCILSTNLRHKSYCIENKQCSKEEFEAKKKEILTSHQSIEAAKNRLQKLKSQSLVKFAFQTKCKNATGDYLFNCHDTKMMFDASNAKACAYAADAEDPIDFYDGNNIYYKPELCLDIMGTLQSFKSKHSTFIFYCNEVEYCDNIHNCTSCFGCIALKKANYCILNKEYSKEAYDNLKEKIIDSMKKEGTYGSFIPPNLAPFGYNETLANDFFSLNKEEALAQGFKWQDYSTGTFKQETIPSSKTPETIEEVKDDITGEILACESCGKNFKITPAELEFYRRMHLPLPHKDFECRHQERMKKRTPRKLWYRQCMCDYKTYNNSVKHSHHKEGRCPNKFETSYSPERKEIVYCEECYNAEVV